MPAQSPMVKVEHAVLVGASLASTARYSSLFRSLRIQWLLRSVHTIPGLHPHILGGQTASINSVEHIENSTNLSHDCSFASDEAAIPDYVEVLCRLAWTIPLQCCRRVLQSSQVKSGE